ncbi:GNAT family N-acetyltransferase [uncultured Roseobacter sp.]|uniref:GNAT family N-acetyltransferase n=1 Tax=uncultured Roseobacter sp. TaxID=114847 RepID=UPI002638D1D1|nr:GNAT family N-acetyltransferase [uncultured Roseobacter sp.]
MTPQQLAALHHAAFVLERPWSAQEFEDLLSNPHVMLFAKPGGFALIRSVAGEIELLTLAVGPAHRRAGVADQLMRDWMDATMGETAFLEVAADNTAARQLYTKHGFAETGRRKRYYKRPNGPAVDAVLMTKALTRR